jgi:hypothetical protein
MASAKSIAVIAIVSAGLMAGGAQAKDFKFFAYDADNAAAKHRSADITLVVRKSFMSSRVIKLYRKRGKDLDLERPDATFSLRQLASALAESEDAVLDLRLYAIDTKDGEGFAAGACDGATRAWVAVKPVKAYQPMRIYVLKYDEATKSPGLCETLEYRWRGEWRLPPGTNTSRFEERGPSSSQR